MTAIPWHDTLWAHHAFASHLPQGLSQLASEYLDVGPWKFKHGRKGAGKASIESLTDDDLAKYNAADVRITAEIWERIQPDLAPEARVYAHDLCLAELCADMQRVGVGIDLARREALSQVLTQDAQTHLAKLTRLSGVAISSPNDHKGIRVALYQALGVKIRVRTAKGQPSTGKEVIESLRGDQSPAGEFCHVLSKAREAEKSRTTYLDPPLEFILPTDPFPRVHYQWGPRESRRETKSGGGHTVSGRLAARVQSAPRYNPNNPPDRVREIYVPGPLTQAPRLTPRVFVYFDVRQGEPRVGAFLTGDPERIKTTLGDVHAENAKIAFPEVAARGWLDSKEAKSDPARGKPFRDLMKNMGLAIDYFAQDERVLAYLAQNRYAPDGKALYGLPRLESVHLMTTKIRRRYKVYVDAVYARLAQVEKVGYLRSPILGRIRWLGWRPSITDVANYPIQSCLADVMNLRSLWVQASPRFIAWMRANPEICARVSLPKRAPKPLPPSIALVMQVHDSCFYDTPKREVSRVEDLLDELWAGKIYLPGGELVLPIDRKIGERMSEL